MFRHWLGLGVLVTGSAAAPLHAQQAAPAAQSLPQALQVCIALRDDSRRLACFDRAVQPLAQGDDVMPDGAAAPPIVAPPAMTPQQRFGFSGDLARKTREASGETAQELREIDAVVTAVAQRGYGQLSVTLDNGLVWSQKAVGQFFRIKVGDRVTVKAAALGSFLLVDAEGRSIRVSRVK